MVATRPEFLQPTRLRSSRDVQCPVPTGLRGSFFAAMAPASARKLTAQGISLGPIPEKDPLGTFIPYNMPVYPGAPCPQNCQIQLSGYKVLRKDAERLSSRLLTLSVWSPE
jgi:hypothetical protein